MAPAVSLPVFARLPAAPEAVSEASFAAPWAVPPTFFAAFPAESAAPDPTLLTFLVAGAAFPPVTLSADPRRYQRLASLHALHPCP